MTEPVAYIYNYANGDYALWHKTEQHIEKAIPLYTKEQLHPRVKMTQAEFYEWKDLYYHLIEYSLSVHKMLDEILESFGVKRGKYVELSKRVYQNNGFMNTSKKQAELVDLFVDYNPDNPEETIEIVPTMKWFVRSKERNSEKNYYYFVGKRLQDLFILYGYKKAAKQFDTKEESERWTNPDTEAVQLAVEDE